MSAVAAGPVSALPSETGSVIGDHTCIECWHPIAFVGWAATVRFRGDLPVGMVHLGQCLDELAERIEIAGRPGAPDSARFGVGTFTIKAPA